MSVKETSYSQARLNREQLLDFHESLGIVVDTEHTA